jgi:hypothetical protein
MGARAGRAHFGEGDLGQAVGHAHHPVEQAGGIFNGTSSWSWLSWPRLVSRQLPASAALP